MDEGRFLPGAILAGRYRMIGPIGKRGMGEVYRADAGSVALFFHFITSSVALTWDWSAWYAGATIGTLACAVAIAAFGYYAARGEEPLFSPAFD